MIAILVKLLASPILGSIAGFLGSWLTKMEDRKQKALDYQHEETMLAARNQQEILVAEKKLQGLIEEGRLAVEKADVDAFGKSQERSSTFGEKVKNMMRAILISYVAIVCGLLTFAIYRRIGGIGAMESVALVGLFADTVSMFFYMFSMGYAWFYGIRGSSSQKAKEAAAK